MFDENTIDINDELYVQSEEGFDLHQLLDPELLELLATGLIGLCFFAVARERSILLRLGPLALKIL